MEDENDVRFVSPMYMSTVRLTELLDDELNPMEVIRPAVPISSAV